MLESGKIEQLNRLSLRSETKSVQTVLSGKKRVLLIDVILRHDGAQLVSVMAVSRVHEISRSTVRTHPDNGNLFISYFNPESSFFV
jgi:transcriptional antiterminator